ncbi:MAG: hypothetical protein N3G77_02305 [Nitrososphaeria archaeon]|nr:hypothetical protein [Nitrososphaeria archaeon]
MKTKITVTEDPGKCNVRFGFYDHPLSFEHFPEEVCVEGDLENLENLIVGYVEFPHIIELDQPAVINNATIYLWKGLKDRHLKAVVLHEIAVLLGLGQARYSRTPPMRSASDLWGSLHVTSIDTYALYLKNRSPEVGRIISPTPPILPYITVELGIYYDIISFSSASLTSLLFYKTYSRRR